MGTQKERLIAKSGDRRVCGCPPKIAPGWNLKKQNGDRDADQTGLLWRWDALQE